LIDLHCHILPGIDDGPESIEESIEMARIARSDGTRTIVATPHTLNAVHSNSESLVATRVSVLERALNRENVDVRICPGADAHLCSGMAARIAAGDAGTINGTGRYVLIEFPPETVPPGAEEELFQLRLKGVTPIITHPERNLAMQNRPDVLAGLVALGCLVQITAMSVTGEFGEETMAASHQMLERRLAHLLASDAHSSDARPPLLSPGLGAAADVLGSMAEAEEMVRSRPAAILAGMDVEVPEARESKKKRWWQC